MCNWVQLCAKGRKGAYLYAEEREDTWFYAVVCDASMWDFGALPPGRYLIGMIGIPLGVVQTESMRKLMSII